MVVGVGCAGAGGPGGQDPVPEEVPGRYSGTGRTRLEIYLSVGLSLSLFYIYL